jgi:hypothetical protein
MTIHVIQSDMTTNLRNPGQSSTPPPSSEARKKKSRSVRGRGAYRISTWAWPVSAFFSMFTLMGK